MDVQRTDIESHGLWQTFPFHAAGNSIVCIKFCLKTLFIRERERKEREERQRERETERERERERERIQTRLRRRSCLRSFI